MLTIVFPNIDPIAFSIYVLDIRWYSLAYIAGILVGFWLFKKLRNYSGYLISDKALDDIILYATFGIIVGGRLGYVLFYDLNHMLACPINIIKVYMGGMSFHGGVIGFCISMYWFCRKYNLQLLALFDILSCVAGIGIFLGRIANFINCEIIGKVTDLPWGVVFPLIPYTRHPVQIYEALSEGLLIFVIMQVLFFCTQLRNYKGALSGIFLILYGSIRIWMETFRALTEQEFLIFDYITIGQILSLPMIIIGIILINRIVFIKK